jgi:hypothetical protein
MGTVMIEAMAPSFDDSLWPSARECRLQPQILRQGARLAFCRDCKRGPWC